MRTPFRLVLLAAGVLFLAGCGRAEMSGEQATQVAIEAFEEAGYQPEVGEIVPAATVARAPDGEFIQVHQVELIVDGVSYLVGVDKKLGAVVHTIEPAGEEIPEEEAVAIAKYRSNPAEEAARPGRIITVLVILALAIGGAYFYFRNERRKALEAEDDDEILLD